MNDETNNHHHCGFAGGRVKRMFTLVLLILAIFLAVKTINTIKEYRFIGGGSVSNKYDYRLWKRRSICGA